MSFRDLMDKYRQGTVNDEEARLVEEELDKYDAINEFQYEQIEQLADRIGTGDDNTAHGAEGAAENIGNSHRAGSEEAFIKNIRREIRKAFIKTGIGVGIGAVVIILFIISVLPGLVSKFYYDPTEAVAEDRDDGEGIDATNRMSLDMAVYTELMVPEARRNLVTANDNGYGDYDIRIGSSVWSDNEHYSESAGKIVRNRLMLYDPGAIERMIANQFAWFQRDRTDISLTQQDKREEDSWLKENPGVDGANLHGTVDRESNSHVIDGLDDNEMYYAYVTLNEMMDYEDFYGYYMSHEDFGRGWCAVKTNEPAEEDELYFKPENIGFEFSPSVGGMLNWDREKYPNLFMSYDGGESGYAEENQADASYANAHFTDMLAYMEEQEDFLGMMADEGLEYPDFDRAKQYVEKNGVIIYGFVFLADKETLKALLKEDEVYSVDVKQR